MLRKMQTVAAWLMQFQGEAKILIRAMCGIFELRICDFLSGEAEESAIMNARTVPLRRNLCFTGTAAAA